jgi:hypothetical protein
VTTLLVRAKPVHSRARTVEEISSNEVMPPGK